jgi:uncharacterized membrane protein YeaQ/YmgE (transglycosylase-associated protein family)
MMGFSGLTHVGNLSLDPGSLIGWVIAALLAGWLAGVVVRGRGFGCLGDMILGLIGAVVGLWVLSVLPVPISGTQGFFGTLVVAFVGALLLAAIGRLIGGGRRKRVVVVQRPPWPDQHTSN